MMPSAMLALFFFVVCFSCFVSGHQTFSTQAAFEAQTFIYRNTLNFSTMGLYLDGTDNVLKQLPRPYVANVNFTCSTSGSECWAWTGQKKQAPPLQGLANAQYFPNVVGLSSSDAYMTYTFPDKAVNSFGGNFFVAWMSISQNYPYIYANQGLLVTATGNNGVDLGLTYVGPTSPAGLDLNALDHYVGFTADNYIRSISIHVGSSLTVVNSFFTYGTTPYECDSNCVQCDLDECFVCATNLWLVDGECEASCPTGYYGDANFVCQPCTEHCDTCYPGICTQCSAGYFNDYSTYNKCSATCPDGQYGDTTTGFCQACGGSCELCSAPLSCDRCAAGSFWDPLFQNCVAVCNQGYFANPTTRTCDKCGDNCWECASTTTCATCEQYYILQGDGTCAYPCPAGYSIDTTSGEMLCSNYAGYFGCFDTLTTYQEDRHSSSSMSIGQCVEYCREKNYTVASLQVGDNCGCATADLPRNMQQATRVEVSNCTVPCAGNSTQACGGGVIDTSDHVHASFYAACDLYRCGSCSSFSHCTKCVPGWGGMPPFLFLKNNGDCVNDNMCPPRTGPWVDADNYGYCVPCGGNCTACGYGLCTACENGLLAYQDTCVQTCPGGTVISNGVCITCPENCDTCSFDSLSGVACSHCATGYYVDGVNCSSCVDFNVNCAECTTTTCTACSNGHYITSSGDCVATCPDKTYAGANHQCLACDDSSCQVCHAASGCDVCESGTYLYDDTCVAACPDQTYTNGRECSDCESHCKTCTGATGCDSCVANYYLFDDSCVSPCPDTTYANGAECSACETNCKTCSSATACSACVSGFYVYNGDCVSTCPEGTSIVNGQCSVTTTTTTTTTATTTTATTTTSTSTTAAATTTTASGQASTTSTSGNAASTSTSAASASTTSTSSAASSTSSTPASTTTTTSSSATPTTTTTTTSATPAATTSTSSATTTTASSSSAIPATTTTSTASASTSATSATSATASTSATPSSVATSSSSATSTVSSTSATPASTSSTTSSNPSATSATSANGAATSATPASTSSNSAATSATSATSASTATAATSSTPAPAATTKSASTASTAGASSTTKGASTSSVPASTTSTTGSPVVPVYRIEVRQTLVFNGTLALNITDVAAFVAQLFGVPLSDVNVTIVEVITAKRATKSYTLIMQVIARNTTKSLNSTIDEVTRAMNSSAVTSYFAASNVTAGAVAVTGKDDVIQTTSTTSKGTTATSATPSPVTSTTGPTEVAAASALFSCLYLLISCLLISALM